MDIAMLILSLISTLTGVVSLIVSIIIRNDAKEIKKEVVSIVDNHGIIAKEIKGGATVK